MTLYTPAAAGNVLGNISGNTETALEWCPESGSNRHEGYPSRDFKSLASTNFTIRAGQCVARQEALAIDSSSLASNATWSGKFRRFRILQTIPIANKC